MTVPTPPLKMAPDPAPMTTPPAINNVSDGECSHTARTASPIPMTRAPIPACRSRVTDQPRIPVGGVDYPRHGPVLHRSLTLSKESSSCRDPRGFGVGGEEELLVNLSFLQQPVRFGRRGHRQGPL